MSNITNEPIMLNETGLQLVERLDQQNALLSLIAEGHREEVYSDITQIANIVRGGFGEKAFPIGDQIIIPWTDVDDDNKVYEVPLNIVRHGDVELETGEIVPGMYLQWHYCSPYGVQFSHQQAFLDCPNGLAAGTYYIGIGDNWGTNTVAGTSWSFTLAQPVPAGGRLSGFEGMPDQVSTNWRVKSWASPTDADPIEMVTVVAGTTGTNLGTMRLTRQSDEGLNCIQAMAYGHNRWSTSAIRQYLNKGGADWFVSQEAYDIRPDQYAKHGFLDGFGVDFLAAIKPIKITTALNTVEGYTDTTEATHDKIFLPSLEEMNGTPQLANVEGPYYEYWRRRLGLNGFAKTGSSNKYSGYLIPGINAQTSPQYVRLRSAYRSSAYTTWYVSSAGFLTGHYASYAARFSPVCVIC